MSNRAIQLIDWNQPVNWGEHLNHGLVSWWLAVPGRAGFGSGTWKDLCKKNDGTLTSMIPATDWVPCPDNNRWGHLEFDGTNDYVDVGNDADYLFGDLSYYCSVIFRPDTISSAVRMMVVGKDVSGARHYAMEINPAKGASTNGTLQWTHFTSNTVASTWRTASSTLTQGQWYHAVFYRVEGNAMKLHLNGKDVSLTQSGALITMNSAGSTNLNIGRRGFSGAEDYFHGAIASVSLGLNLGGTRALYDEFRARYPNVLRRIRPAIGKAPAGVFSITAEAASYTVTGTDASLEQGYSVSAESASYTVTGTDASLEQGYAIAADGATYTVTGADATLLHGYAITVDAAAYTVTGTDVTLTVGAGGTFTLTADAATYTVTGTDASLFHGYVLTAYNTASAGFVATSSQYYTGTTIAFGTGDFAFACWVYLNDTTGVKTIVSLGSVTNDIEHLWLTVSGTSLFMSLNDSVQATRLTWTFGAGFSTGWNHIVVNFDRSGNATCWINGGAPTAPTVDISGHAAALNPTTFYVGRKVAGSDYMDGRIDKLIYTNAILDSSEIAELSAGAKLSNFSSGLSAKTVYGWEMEAVDGGTQTSSFTSNDLVPTNTPTQEEGYSTGGGSLFAITGTDASLEQGYSIAVDAASYTVTGTDATVEWNRVLSASAATFTVTGTDVTLNYSGSVGFSLTAEGTQIVLNASNATLTYSALLNEFPELDFSTDYLIMDFPESVTYISTSQYGDTRYTVAKAIQAQPSHQERATSGGTYAGYDLTWLLPGVLMNTTPKISDVILDDAGTEWTIINAQYDQMDRMWNMQTVNLVLFFDLRDQIWLYKPDTASTLVDAAGRYTPTFTPAATLIPARIQEQRGDFSEERGKRGTQRTYQIFILEPITDITTEWYAQDTSGNKYDITGWTNKATITDLMTLEAVKRA